MLLSSKCYSIKKAIDTYICKVLFTHYKDIRQFFLHRQVNNAIQNHLKLDFRGDYETYFDISKLHRLVCFK